MQWYSWQIYLPMQCELQCTIVCGHPHGPLGDDGKYNITFHITDKFPPNQWVGIGLQRYAVVVLPFLCSCMHVCVRMCNSRVNIKDNSLTDWWGKLSSQRNLTDKLYHSQFTVGKNPLVYVVNWSVSMSVANREPTLVAGSTGRGPILHIQWPPIQTHRHSVVYCGSLYAYIPGVYSVAWCAYLVCHSAKLENCSCIVSLLVSGLYNLMVALMYYKKKYSIAGQWVSVSLVS